MNKPFLVAACAVAVSVGLAVSASAGNNPRSGGVPAAPARPAAASVSASCPTTKTDFITNDNLGLSTSSTTSVPVPGMTASVRQGGAVPHCIVVTTSGFTFAAQNNNALEMWFVTVDGVGCSPSEVQASGDDDENNNGKWAREHAAVWVCQNVSPGLHSVAFLFRSFFGETVFIHRPAMSIQHI